METSEIRKRLNQTIERAKRQAAERRARGDEAARAFETFLSTTAVPLFRQVANILRSDGYLFTVFTPSGSVRLMSDRSGRGLHRARRSTRPATSRRSSATPAAAAAGASSNPSARSAHPAS